MTSDDDVVTIDDIKRARDIIMASQLKVRKTPLLKNMTSYFPELDPSLNLNMKLESLQSTGIFFSLMHAAHEDAIYLHSIFQNYTYMYIR